MVGIQVSCSYHVPRKVELGLSNNVVGTDRVEFKPVEIWIIDFKLFKASDIDKAREIILEEANLHPVVMKNRTISVFLTGVPLIGNDVVYNLKLFITVPGRDVALRTGCDIREAVEKRFEQVGIRG